MAITKKFTSVFGKAASKTDNAFDAQRFFFDKNEKLIIFDVGAYIGEITKIYKKIFPNSTIYCFEPFPGSFKQLGRLSINEFIKPYQIAISDHINKTKLYVDTDLTCNSLFPRPKNGKKYYPHKNENPSTIEVETTTIDNFCNIEKISHIDILKLDVEGAEKNALKGAKDKLKKHLISIIYTEVMFISHYEGGCMFHELADFLEQYDYTLFNLYNLKRAKDGQLRWGNAIFLSPQTRAKFNQIHSV
ncbi:MAG: FkbM family methyltransferase [Phycisphaerales bacterium]|jgi:FkbM family methyltransferase